MSNKEVALIMAGGRGTRMDILCYSRPKPVLPFAGRFRVIDFTASNCIHSRISDIAVLVDHHRAPMMEYMSGWHILNGGDTNLTILAPKTDSYAGTADAVFQNLDYLNQQDTDTVLVLAGDHVYKMDYSKMIEFHRLMQAGATVGVVPVPVEEAGRFGTVTVDAVNRITEFKEKSSASTSNLASMGIYVFDKDLITRYLTEDAAEPGSLHDFGYNILPRMVRNERVFAYEFQGYWHDIGTVGAYYQANMELLAPRPRFSLDSDWPVLHEINTLTVATGQEGRVLNSLISPGCIIKGNVENSVLSPGVQVAEGAVVRNSVVMAGASVGYGSVVNGCIIDENVSIGKVCYVGYGTGRSAGNLEVTVLGKDVRVPDGTAIGRNCNIKPGLGPDDFNQHLIPPGTTLVRS